MKLFDLIRRAARSLRNAKARTALTSLAIAVGAFTLTITLAAGNGIHDYTDRLVANNFDPAESIVGRDKEIENNGAPNTKPQEYNDSISSVTVGGDGSSLQLKQITDKDIEELKAQSFVEEVRANYQISVRYVTREGQKKYTASSQAYNPGQKPELEAGKLPEKGSLKKGTVLLPKDYVALLGFKNAKDAIGKTIDLNIQQPFSSKALQDYLKQVQSGTLALDSKQPQQQTKTVTLEIAGVSKPSAASLSFAGLPIALSNDDAKEMYDFTTKDTPNYGKYLYAYVRVKGGENDQKALDAKKALKEKGYYVQTSQDIQKTITQFVDILQVLVAVFGVITVIASVFGIVNTMYISVLERTREIGLMKALGMRGIDIGWLFRLEAAWIGFLGGIIGSALAWIFGVAINPWLSQTLNLGKGNSILIFDPVQMISLIGILMLIAILAGWLPARKAAKLDPIAALRTE